jgi:hypothetical protein
MEIEFIFTYCEGYQDVAVAPFEFSLLDNKDVFVDAVLQNVPDSKKLKLIKISCCVYADIPDDALPQWYWDCNGKFYFENGVLLN